MCKHRGTDWMKVKNYSFDHSTLHFRIMKNGRYYGCCKTKEQAEKMVELFRECNWDYDRKDEIKSKVVGE